MANIYNYSESERILSDALNNSRAYLSPRDHSVSAKIRRTEAVRRARSEVEPLIRECQRAGRLTLGDFLPLYCTSSFGFGCRS